MSAHGALEDREYPPLAGMTRRGADLEPATPGGAQLLERLLPVRIAQPIVRFVSRGQNQVFVIGALSYEGADLVGGEDVLLFELAELRDRPLEVESCFFCDAGHFCCAVFLFGHLERLVVEKMDEPVGGHKRKRGVWLEVKSQK